MNACLSISSPLVAQPAPRQGAEHGVATTLCATSLSVDELASLLALAIHIEMADAGSPIVIEKSVAVLLRRATALIAYGVVCEIPAGPLPSVHDVGRSIDQTRDVPLELRLSPEPNGGHPGCDVCTCPAGHCWINERNRDA